ncbi:uncharacterized protein LOC135687488 [Rhopilema esculentum]|uniref:uncharacterized protein LOC135687488 n=1 Tax=Rhopilema esculentum TaxID=499914 RepID=UPI0031D9970D
MPTPKSVTVIVYGGKCLKPKKKDGVPLAWVVFGFGKSKCCTAQIRDINPKWNEENTFMISDPRLPLKLTVKDRDDTLGQIQIPLTEIPHEEHTFKWVAIGPHRRNLNPSGEICVDCWISEYNETETPTKKETNFFKFKQRFNVKQFAERDRKGSIKYGGTSLKGSISVEDLGAVTYKPTFSKTLERPKNVAATGMKRASSLFLSPKNEGAANNVKSERSPSLGDLSPVAEKVSDPPEIRFISPISGPSSGGTVVQITGKNLGESKSDIIHLTVAGVDCLSTVEYISSTKVMCTTRSGDSVGPVSLATALGGTTKSKTQFAFENSLKFNKPDATFLQVDDQKSSKPFTKKAEKVQNGKPPLPGHKGRDKNEQTDNLKKEVEELTKEVKVLKVENMELRSYVDSLLLYLMEKYPEALESRRLYR